MAAPSIVPIPTLYKGYLCRSRLEARWCIFFDTIGIVFNYEPRGFRLNDGTNYLPDFYLPQIDMYVEIKPTRSGFEKAGQLTEETGICVLCLFGPPEFISYFYFDKLCEDSLATPIDTHLDIHDGSDYYFEENRLFSGCDPRDYTNDRDFSEKYREAVFTAMHARFDQGATYGA